MILSGRDIQLYIEADKLKIHPVSPAQFQQNGLDMVLSDFKRVNSLFGLGCVAETIELPDDLMAFVQLRSTWARHGFALPPTIVDAGFRGVLTLEVITLTSYEVPVGQRFAHLIFARTSGPCEKYFGKYQDQTGITGAR